MNVAVRWLRQHKYYLVLDSTSNNSIEVGYISDIDCDIPAAVRTYLKSHEMNVMKWKIASKHFSLNKYYRLTYR